MSINWNFELTNVALFIGAVIAAVYARRQVAELRESNHKLAESGLNQEQQLRASVLLRLDERWESPSMMAARADLETVFTEVRSETRRSHPEPGALLQYLSAPNFERHLKELRGADLRKQRRLLQICGFFETVGYVAQAGYVTPDDIYQLLGGSIITAGEVFLPYIEWLLRQDASPDLYRNFRWLVDQIRRKSTFSAVQA